MTENEFKYWAFISYCALDNTEQRPGETESNHLRWADRLAETLQSFSVPTEFVGQPNSRGEIIPDRIQPIYQPVAATSENAALSDTDIAALTQSRCLIVICSPRSARSESVQEAVRRFKQLGRSNRILPLVIGGEPNASDSAKAGVATTTECFVPALLHPVSSDGTVDATRREAGYFFADARYGADRSEISTDTELLGETEQAIAKIHLISGVLGVGFYGLWQREQKRRFIGFAAAQQQVREVQSQFAFARDQAQSAQAQLQALQVQARETLSQLESARQEVRDAQNRFLASQNVPLDVQTQIREAQDKASSAQSHAQAIQNQLDALQAQSRASQEQLETTRQQIEVTEQRAVAAEQQARIAQAQVEQARQQTREAQQQLEKAREQVHAAPEKPLAVQTSSTDSSQRDQELPSQLLAAQEQARLAQTQLALATARAEKAESSLAAAETQTRTAHQHIQELQTQSRLAQSQLDEVRQEVRAAQEQVREIETQTRDVQAQIQAAQQQVADARKQTRLAQDELALTRQQSHAAGRRTKVLAVLAVLAALAAGLILSHHKTAKPDPKANETFLSASATNQLDLVQIRAALELSRGLDSFPARIPTDKISETLQIAANILSQEKYARLENQLLDRWMTADARGAFDWSQQLTNTETRSPYVAKTLLALANSSPTNCPMAFDWLQSTNAEVLLPGDRRDATITSLLTNWATIDLASAASANDLLPDGTLKQNVASFILSQRIEKDPTNSVSLVTNLPVGDLRKLRLAELSRNWANLDATNALLWAEGLPIESDRALATRWAAERWLEKDFTAATNWIAGLPTSQKNTVLTQLAETWNKQDRASLVDYALTQTTGSVQTELLKEAFRPIATNDFATAFAALQPLTNNAALRLELVEQAAGRSANLRATADFIVQMNPGDDQSAAIKGLVRNWSTLASEATLDWLRSFPETNAHPTQVEFVMTEWSQREPARAAQWIAKQPTNFVSEATLNAYLDGAVLRYPEFAAQWTQAIADEAQRQKLQVHLAKQWLKQNAIAAQQWIDTLDLPARLKRSLR